MTRSNVKKHKFVYEDPFACDGFEVFRPACGAMPVSFMEFVTMATKAQCMVQDIQHNIDNSIIKTLIN